MMRVYLRLARRRARRKYTRIIVNAFVMNPGASLAPIASPQKVVEGQAAQPPQGDGRDNLSRSETATSDEESFERFGLMASFVRRWALRLPQALASGAGEHVQIPPGNADLINILEPYEKK